MILGIDPGTHCGWAIIDSDGAFLTSGEWNLTGSRFDGAGMRYIRLHKHLADILDSLKVDLVAYEEVRRHIGTDAAHVYGAIVGLIQRECEARNIPYTGIPVGTVKKHATGKGSGKKEAMLGAARARWPDRTWSTKDNNEIDARFIAECGVKEMT
jgi:crossover junction endodeoxyribonuclease RuvC